jgi:hypothetical protein
MGMDEPGSNEQLHAALREAGMTYDQLARAVRTVAAESGDDLRTNKSAVAHWVKGSRPAPATSAYVCEALARRLGRHLEPADLGFEAVVTDESDGTGGTDRAQARLGLGLGPDPVDMLRRLGDADIQRRSLLVRAAYSVAAAALPLGADQAADYAARVRPGRRAGTAEIEAVLDMTRLFTAIDERHGGQHGRTAVAQYLREDVATLCRATFARERDRKAMLSAAANVAYLCGWKAYDANEHGLAQRYYLQAFALTRDAGEDLHGAWIMRILAHNGMDIRRPEHTIDLAEAALARVRGRVDPATEAQFTITCARALAVAGRAKDAAAHVRAAQDLVIRGDDADVPVWAALWGGTRATVASHTAKTARALGDHATAEKHFAASARARGGGDRQRIAALTAAAQGREQAAQGHLEQACDTWSRSLDLMTGVRSARAAKEVGGIRRQLRSFEHRGVRPAADLDERARAWQRAYA